MKQMPDQASPVRAGVVIMSTAAFLTPIPDAIAKILGDQFQISPLTIALLRFALQTALMFPVMFAFGGVAAFVIRKPVLNMFRGVLLAVGSVSFFSALKTMDLADAIAIFFVQPLIATILAIVFLREAADSKRLFTVGLGFVGVLIVVRPNLAASGWIALLPLVCAVCVAIYLLLGRYLAPGNSSTTMHFYTGVGALIALFCFSPFGSLSGINDFQLTLPHAVEAWSLVALMTFLGSLVHLMYIHAYRRAPAGLLAPFNYLEIVSAAALGFALFKEVPDFWKAVGMAIIMASGLLLAWNDTEIKAKSTG